MSTKKNARLDTLKSLLREIELLGDMVMTTGLEGQDATTEEEAVRAVMSVEGKLEHLQKILTAVKALPPTGRA